MARAYTSTITQFTTLAEIERLFSGDAISLRIDDAADANAEADIIDEVIDDATEWVWQFLWLNYEKASAVIHPWVRRRATFVAAHFLSLRRGNGGQFIDRFENIKEELQLVYARSLFIPDLNVLASPQPTVSNFIIDNRGYGPVQRVTADSMGTYPGQKTTLNNPFPEII